MKKALRALALILAVCACGASFCACKDKKYAAYDSTGEKYDYYLPDYVKVCKYTGIELPDLTFEPTEEDISKRVKQNVALFCLREEDPDRPCQAGDVVDIITTCTFTEDGSTYSLLNFKKDSVTGFGQSFVLGTNYFYFPALDEAVEGMSAGESKTVTLTLPDPYYKDYLASGKEIKMEIYLNYIDSIDYAQVDENFYAEHIGYGSADYREVVRNKLKAEYAELVSGYKAQLAWNYICENSKLLKLPEKEYQETYDTMLDSARTNAQNKDMSLEDYVKSLGYDSLDDYYAYLEDKSENICYEDMILYYIVRRENINYTDEYYDEQILAMVEEYQISDLSAAEDFLDYYYGIENVREEVRMKYAQEWIADNAKVVEDVHTVYDNNLNGGK